MFAIFNLHIFSRKKNQLIIRITHEIRQYSDIETGIREITICTPSDEEVSRRYGDVRDDIPMHIALLVPAKQNTLVNQLSATGATKS